jgi:hypothetical protein
MSTPRIMKAGVPQGSFLSHTLFNMYVNDTSQTIGVHIALFAVSMRQNARGLCPKKTSAWTQLSGGMV